MGAGRKTQTFNVDSRSLASENSYISFRNLPKSDLGGVIFGCKHTTMPECLSKQLFGLPSAHFSYVRNIDPGLPIFHFNYNDRKLHGIYESASHGKMYIDAYAWTDGGAERTAFPAQVRIRIKEQCKPLVEKEYKTVLEDNYYTPLHFWFELDHLQTRCLIGLFKPYPPTYVRASGSFNLANSFPQLPVPKNKSLKDVKRTSSGTENKFAMLSWDNENSDYGLSNRASSNTAEGINFKDPASSSEELLEGYLFDGSSSIIGADSNEISQNMDEQPVDTDDYKNVLVKLEKLSADCKLKPSIGVMSENEKLCAPEELHNPNMQNLNDPWASSEKNENSNVGNLFNRNDKTNCRFLDTFVKEGLQGEVNICDGNTNRDLVEGLKEPSNMVNQVKESTSVSFAHGTVELLEAIRELKERTASLEKQQAEADAEIQHLRNLHRNSGQLIRHLETRLNAVDLKIGTSVLLDDDKFSVQASEELIFLIGGFNGSTWLSSLDSFSPSLDILMPLKSMSCPRSYASAVVLNRDIYVLGGGDGSSWYNTVEYYDERYDAWKPCPPMIHEKGSLACATLSGKIYAIGGGDGFQTFSDVEMLDPALGRWISWQSMIHQRFAPTAAELNGVLYAVGGYDGQKYLKSAESIDPRAISCTIIPDMISSRGCHSMTVLNEKLFVMGGYDGHSMVSTVEIYDPRANAWMAGEPMKFSRGYAASVLFDDSIVMIGGIIDSDSIEDMQIECYKEGSGWNNSRLKAVGKRCFFSAVVL